MKQRLIAGTPICAIGLGCMGMSQYNGSAEDDESLRLHGRAYENIVLIY